MRVCFVFIAHTQLLTIAGIPSKQAILVSMRARVPLCAPSSLDFSMKAGRGNKTARQRVNCMSSALNCNLRWSKPKQYGHST